MLEFLTGADSRAKRAYIGERLNEAVLSGGRAVLVVPEQENFERDKALLLRYGERVSNAMTVTSISRFCRTFLEDRALSVKPEADGTAKNVLMSLAVRQVRDELEIYAGHDRRPGRIAALTAFYDTLAAAGKAPEDLRSAGAAAGGSLKEKTRELSLIFTAYRGLLTERFSTETDNIRVVTGLLPQTEELADTEFWFDDFRGFTGAQLSLIGALLGVCRNVHVSVCGCAEGSGKPFFAHAQKNRRRLTELANRAGVPVTVWEIPCVNTSPGLDFLRDRLFNPTGEAFAGVPEDIVLLRADNRYEECELIALYARKLLDEGVCRAGEIAVLHQDEAFARPLINAFRKYGVPVFDDRRRALTSYPPVRFLLRSAELAAKGFTTENVLSCIKTGMSGVSVEAGAALQNYVYLWQIDGREWESPFTRDPRGYGSSPDDETREALAQLNETRSAFIAPVLRFRAALQTKNGADCCRAAYEYLRDTSVPDHFRDYAVRMNDTGNEALALECAGVWDVCMEYLDALAGALGDKRVSPTYFYELLTLIFSGGTVGVLPSGVDKAAVGAVGRARIPDRKAVFIAGFVEGAFPRSTVRAGLLSAKELRTLSEADLPLEQLPEEIYEEDRLIVYQALTLPEKRLFLSWHTSLITGEKTEPSPLLGEIGALFPDLKAAAAPDARDIARVCSPGTAFDVYTRTFASDQTLHRSLEAALDADAVYRQRIAALQRARTGIAPAFTDPALAVRLFGKNIPMSASKAETYARCPFRYYCRYGMGVEKLAPARLDARVNGLIIHKALEDILGARLGEDLGDLTDEALYALADKSVEDYCRESLGGKDGMPPAVQRTVERLKREIFDILLVRRDEFNTCLFRTAAVELPIGYPEGIDGYTVTLPDGGVITVRGSIDRVDIMRNGETSYVRVIDYKTGGKDFSLGEVYYGLNMQMLIYLYAVCDHGEERFGKLLPAGILYLPAKNTGKTLDRRASDEAVMRQKLENGRMNGVILENADVIKGMETAARGVYINAQITPDGTLKGNFLTQEEFRLLHRRIDGILRETGENIHRGLIPVLPAQMHDGALACDYCDYAAVCGHEGASETRPVPNIDHEKAVERLHEEEAEV